MSKINKSLEKAWISLYERSTYDSVPPFSNRWTSFGIGYPYNIGLGHWDTPQIANELVWLDVNEAEKLLNTYFTALFREVDGMMAIWVRSSLDPRYNPDTRGAEFPCSHPPIWPLIAVRILQKRWDELFAERCLEIGIKNIEWWDINRRFANQLYWYEDSLSKEDRRWESGYDLSPRWDDTSKGPFPCIDINCQMVLYFECMSWISARCNKDDRAVEFKNRAEKLKSLIRENFWNNKLKFFVDITSKPKKTIASFWTLIAGIPTESQLEYLINSLTDMREFRAPYGLTTVSLSESSYELDCWRGPMWMSQVFWVSLGLQRYGLIDLSKEITIHCLKVVREVLDETGKIWEFYNPIDGDIKKLKRKGKDSGPFGDYSGHNPLLSLQRISEGENIWFMSL
ncbi:hypothetical protein H5T89_01485 [bacterium]|nr:hypothetical protein [bacterium]